MSTNQIARLDEYGVHSEIVTDKEKDAVRSAWKAILALQANLKSVGVPGELAAHTAYDEVVLGRLQKRDES